MAQKTKGSSPSYKLTYFNAKARGEVSRLMFKLKDVPFEDNRIAFDQWGALKPNTPFGGLPILEVDGEVIGQSRAVERLIAKRLGLYGKDDMEQALVDSMVDRTGDIQKDVIKIKFMQPEEEKVKEQKKFVDETAPQILASLENMLKKNANGNGFTVGTSLSWADLAIFEEVIDGPIKIGVEFDLSKYPTLKKLIGNVQSNANLKKWLAERPKTEL